MGRRHPLAESSGPAEEAPGPGLLSGAGLAAGRLDGPVAAGLSGAALAVLGLDAPELAGPELSGAVLAGGELDGAVLAGGGPVGAVLAGGGVVLGRLGLEELGPGLADGLAQVVGPGLAALACAEPDGLGLGTWAVPAWGALEGLGLAGPVVAADGLAGLVLAGLGLAGFVVAGGVLAGLLVPAGLVAGGDMARADPPGVQLAPGCP
jgi:hypothetical protein